jgi:hypothetical protein
MTYLILSLLSAFLSGVSRGFHQARRDYALRNKAEDWMDEERYVGGWRFNQSYPWTADHCHQMMHLQVLFLAISGFLYGFNPLGWWGLIWIWLVWWIEGRGFTLFYHVILPDPPKPCDYSFWVWLRGWIY